MSFIRGVMVGFVLSLFDWLFQLLAFRGNNSFLLAEWAIVGYVFAIKQSKANVNFIFDLVMFDLLK